MIFEYKQLPKEVLIKEIARVKDLKFAVCKSCQRSRDKYYAFLKAQLRDKKYEVR